MLPCIRVCRRFTAAQKAENQQRYTSHKKNQVQSDGFIEYLLFLRQKAVFRNRDRHDLEKAFRVISWLTNYSLIVARNLCVGL